MTKIFISYRRDDSQWPVDSIYKTLKQHVTDPGSEIFIDVDSIPAGANWAAQLDAKVAQCDVLLAVIGPGWLNIKNPRTGMRRLDEPDDFVRIEIASALKLGIAVAPVLLDGVSLPQANELPEDLRPLIGRQAVNISRINFDADVGRLIRRLGLDRRATPIGAAASKREEPRRSPALLIALVVLLFVVAGGVGTYGFAQGWFSQAAGAPNVVDASAGDTPSPALVPFAAADPAASTITDPADTAAWNIADSVKSADAYNSYLYAYPRGEHAEEARTALARVLDDAKWTKASGQGRMELNSYLAAHPSGTHAQEARTQLAAIDAAERAAAEARSETERKEVERKAAEQREADRKEAERNAEDAAWAIARSANTPATFREYLRQYPNGLFADQARRAISTAAAATQPSASPPRDALTFPNKPTQ